MVLLTPGALGRGFGGGFGSPTILFLCSLIPSPNPGLAVTQACSPPRVMGGGDRSSSSSFAALRK